MNVEIFAEWLRRQEYSVIKTHSSYWYEARRRVYQAFPFHWMIEPCEDELHHLLTKQHAFALRYSTPLQSPLGCISYHAIYDKPTYTLDILDRRSRQNVRSGLKKCQVEPISLARLAEEGWSLEKDTANRQGRGLALSEAVWRLRCTAAEDLAGFEAWGALVDGRLVASLLTFQMEDWCELISQQCHRDYLNARVNNALTFVVTETMVRRPEIRSIFYALQSLDAPSSVDEFKFRMGYRASPLRQRVVFHPWFKPCANGLTSAMVRRLLRRYPGNYTLAKAEGMLRFHLQGKLSLKDQDWPECMIESRSECERVACILGQTASNPGFGPGRLPFSGGALSLVHTGKDNIE